MIGKLTLGPSRTATLEDDRSWSSDDPLIAELLNEQFGPDNHETGDHHQPNGVAVLERAAEFLDVKFTVAVDSLPALGEGEVS